MNHKLLLVLLLSAVRLKAADDYQLGPDSRPQAGVLQGKGERLTLPTSRSFPGADHDCWVYIPAQHDAAKPASLMVFQNGGGDVKRDGLRSADAPQKPIAPRL